MTPALILCLTVLVHDGDTMRCDREKVRVAGLDAPELPGSSACARGKPAVGTPRCDFAAGKRSAAYAAAWISRATRVTIQPLGHDPWCNRIVARVKVDGQDFASHMVKAGHGVRVRETARKDCR